MFTTPLLEDLWRHHLAAHKPIHRSCLNRFDPEGSSMGKIEKTTIYLLIKGSIQWCDLGLPSFDIGNCFHVFLIQRHELFSRLWAVARLSSPIFLQKVAEKCFFSGKLKTNFILQRHELFSRLWAVARLSSEKFFFLGLLVERYGLLRSRKACIALRFDWYYKENKCIFRNIDFFFLQN